MKVPVCRDCGWWSGQSWCLKRYAVLIAFMCPSFMPTGCLVVYYEEDEEMRRVRHVVASG